MRISDWSSDVCSSDLTGLSRNTIRKYLRSETIDPRFKVPDRPSKLDPFAEHLAAWLRREMGRSRKQKRTIKQFHADLVSLGYEGSYNRVAAFARDWREDYRRQQQISGRGTFVPLSLAPGERSEEHTSELQSLMRISYAVFCLKKKKQK